MCLQHLDVAKIIFEIARIKKQDENGKPAQENRLMRGISAHIYTHNQSQVALAGRNDDATQNLYLFSLNLWKYVPIIV